MAAFQAVRRRFESDHPLININDEVDHKMSRALVNQIVNQSNSGPVEFPFGATISPGAPLRLGGPLYVSNNAVGTVGQILKSDSNSQLVWADSDTVTLFAGDGQTSSRKTVRLTQSGNATTTEVVFEAGNNVSLSRSGNVITVSSSYIDTDTITNLRLSGNPYVNGDITLLSGGSTTITQSGSNFTISSTDTQYSAGTGVTLTGTTFSIPQEIDTTSDVTFNNLTLTGNLSAVDGGFSGNVTGTWDGGTIPINKGGTGSTTATSAFIALAPSISAASNKFLTTDGSNIYWDNLPAASGLSQLTYTLSGQDGPVVNSAKVRNTDSDGNFSEVVFSAADDITINRSGNTITIGSTNALDTTLTPEEVQDIIGDMIDNTANVGITVTYNDATAKLEYNVASSSIVDTDTTYDLQTTTITSGVGLQLVPGGSGSGNAVDQINFIAGTNVNIARDSSTGSLTFSSSDTNTDTITRLTIAGPGTSGGNNPVSGDITFQASGNITLAQSGNTIAISSSDTNSYVDGLTWAPLTGALTVTRSDSLQDLVLPITNLQTYLDNRYIQTATFSDSRISSANFNSSNGNLSLNPNDGSPAIIVNLDGRYATDTGDNFYVTSGSIVAAGNNPGGFHVNRQLLQLTRNDSQNVLVEFEPLYDYLDTLYAPVGLTDTRLKSATFTSGDLRLVVGDDTTANDNTYLFDFDARYVRQDNYTNAAEFNTTTGVLTLRTNTDNPSGTGSVRPDITVDLDGRYKLQDALDIYISELIWNPTTGNLYASRNNNTNTLVESLDGRYINNVTFSAAAGTNTFTFVRTGGSNTVITLPAQRVDVPVNSRMLFVQSSAPTGWTKETNSTFNDRALRVTTSVGGNVGGARNFSAAFVNDVETGGSVTKGNLAITGNPNGQFASGFTINKGNLAINGSPTANLSSGFSVNKGNLSVSSHTLSTAQIPTHDHNYQRPNYNGIADTDDGKLSRDSSGTQTGTRGGSGSHSHSLNGNPSVSGSISTGKGNLAINGNPQYSGSISVAKGNLGLTGNPTFTAGDINLNIKYVDVIICTRAD